MAVAFAEQAFVSSRAASCPNSSCACVDDFALAAPPPRPRLLALQGSSTYLLKFLGLDNRVVHTSTVSEALRAQLHTWERLFDTDGGAGAEGAAPRPFDFDFTNLVNVVFGSVMLRSTPAATDYLISQRKFTDADGGTIFTSMWAGYVGRMLRAEEPTELPRDFTFVDIGTGELKFFDVSSSGYGSERFASAGQCRASDGERFLALFSACVESSSAAADPAALAALADVFGPPAAEVRCVASEGLRVLRAAHPAEVATVLRSLAAAHNIHIDIVSGDYEALCESDAIGAALRQAADLPDGIDGKQMIGNLAWGNGSTQGHSAVSGATTLGIGLNTLKAHIEAGSVDGSYPSVAVQGEGRAKTVTIGTAAAFQRVVAGTRTALLSMLQRADVELA